MLCSTFTNLSTVQETTDQCTSWSAMDMISSSSTPSAIITSIGNEDMHSNGPQVTTDVQAPSHHLYKEQRESDQQLQENLLTSCYHRQPGERFGNQKTSDENSYRDEEENRNEDYYSAKYENSGGQKQAWMDEDDCWTGGTRSLHVGVAHRNARERRRVQTVNGAFVTLRRAVPAENNRGKRISKVKTLKNAIKYIQTLQDLLRFNNDFKSSELMDNYFNNNYNNINHINYEH